VETNLQEGMELYVDRDYTLTTLPEAYRGLDWIKTANDSADWMGEDPIATFVITRDSTVFVAYDNRVEPPPILKGWKKTGDSIEVDCYEMVWFDILCKDFKAGSTVKMGQYEEDAGIYTIMVRPNVTAAKTAKPGR
jgi:hypothetical protein